MSNNKLIGIVLLVVGAGLAWWGYDMSQSVGNQLTQAFNNSTKKEVIFAYVGAAACIVAGLFLAVRSK